MFDVEFLGIFIFFIIAMFDQYKKDKKFFFIVTGIGALVGILNYAIPMFIPQEWIGAAKSGIYIALGVSGLLGLAKSRIAQNQNKTN